MVNLPAFTVGSWFKPCRVSVEPAYVRLSIEELRSRRALFDVALEEEPVARAIAFGTGQEEGFEALAA